VDEGFSFDRTVRRRESSWLSDWLLCVNRLLLRGRSLEKRALLLGARSSAIHGLLASRLRSLRSFRRRHFRCLGFLTGMLNMDLGLLQLGHSKSLRLVPALRLSFRTLARILTVGCIGQPQSAPICVCVRSLRRFHRGSLFIVVRFRWDGRSLLAVLICDNILPR